MKLSTLVGISIAPLLVSSGWAQLGTFTREQRTELTRAWKGERFEDGRPKIPDSILERAKTVSAEDAWAVLYGSKYPDQFEGGWKRFNAGGERLVGRAVTAVFMPVRPDVAEVIADHGKAEGRAGFQNSWVIETLKPGDVLVVDMWGKVKDGTFIGDNLGTSIYKKTGTGVVINGSVRDLTGLSEIKGFTGYVRDFSPTIGLYTGMLMGINVPIRIGETTVMPGDMVLGDPEGVMFIPPILAEKVVTYAEDVHLRDEWSHEMLKQGKYTSAQIDQFKWAPDIEADFQRWAAGRRKK